MSLIPASPVFNPCRGLNYVYVSQSVSYHENHHESHSGRIEKAKYPAFLHGSEPIFMAWGTFVINLKPADVSFRECGRTMHQLNTTDNTFFVALNLAWLDSNMMQVVLDLGQDMRNRPVPAG